MPSSTLEASRLYLTKEFLAVEARPIPKKSVIFATEIKRFPPVEDVLTVLDRIASRTFTA
jgi:hypothetical protein